MKILHLFDDLVGFKVMIFQHRCFNGRLFWHSEWEPAAILAMWLEVQKAQYVKISIEIYIIPPMCAWSMGLCSLLLGVINEWNKFIITILDEEWMSLIISPQKIRWWSSRTASNVRAWNVWTSLFVLQHCNTVTVLLRSPSHLNFHCFHFGDNCGGSYNPC